MRPLLQHLRHAFIQGGKIPPALIQFIVRRVKVEGYLNPIDKRALLCVWDRQQALYLSSE
tara:strand:+ start:157 stop:336 length:180 start_codon:yes stop_codon:yes gene_type:complete